MTAVRVLDHAVLRVAAWPVEALASLEAPKLALSARLLIARELEHQQASDSLADQIHEEIPSVVDTSARRWLLTVRRALHSGRRFTDDAPRAVMTSLAAEIRSLAAEREQLAAERLAFTEQYWRLVESQRRVLRDIGGEPTFRRALALTYPELSARWDRVHGSAPADTARSIRLDRAVTRRLLRAAGRPAPDAAWAGYAAVVPGSTEAGASLDLESVPRRVTAAIDLRVFRAVLETWGRQLGAADDHLLRADSSLHRRSDGWWYVRGEPGRARSRNLPDHPLLDRVIAWWENGDQRTPAGLVDALAEDATDESRAASTKRARALIERLLSLGILRSALTLPTDGADPWEVLDQAGHLLPDGLRTEWERAAEQAREVCETLSVTFDDLEPHEVRALGARAHRAVSRLFATAGIADAPPRSVIRVTLGVGIRARWDEHARAGVATSIQAALAGLGANGAAEAVRARAAGLLTSRLPCSATELLAQLADQGSLPADRAPQTRDEAVRMAGVEPTAIDCASAADPGPTGTAILVPAELPWFRWGRPQPGFVTARAAGVLGPDGAAAVENLSEELSGIDAIEIRGADPDNPNASIGPRLTEPVIEPRHLRETRIEHGSDDFPVLSVGGSTPRIAVYSGGSVIGRHDPASRLLRMLAMAHGWELVGWGEPLAASDVSSELPEVVIDGAALLAPRRWTISTPDVAALIELSGADRYMAWRAELDQRSVPDLVLARMGLRPDGPEAALPTTSPLALDAFFDAPGDRSGPLVLTALPDAGSWPVVTAAGHHLAELAVTWLRGSARGCR